MTSPDELLSDGDLPGALSALQQLVRLRPDDAKLRVFLFQLLAVLGQWQRALTQLQVCAELDPATLPMVATYRDAIQCEAVREAVFAGKTLPHVLGKPQAWLAYLAEALGALGRGDTQVAHTMRSKALEQAPETQGAIDGKPFAWISDGDSRLGPVLEAIVNGRYCWVPLDAISRIAIEAPCDLRDLVWAPAQLEFPHGGTSVALLPVRYVARAEELRSPLQLSRLTEWQELGEGHVRGIGQRMLLTDTEEYSLLGVREIVFDGAARPSVAQAV